MTMKPKPNFSAAEVLNVRARVSALIESYERELSEFAAELAKHLKCTRDVAESISRQIPTFRRCIREKNLEMVLRDRSRAAFQKNRYSSHEKGYRARKKTITNVLAAAENLRAECAAQKIVAAVIAADQLIAALKNQLAFIEPAEPMQNGTRYHTPFELRRQIADELFYANDIARCCGIEQPALIAALRKTLHTYGVETDRRTLARLFPKKKS